MPDTGVADAVAVENDDRIVDDLSRAAQDARSRLEAALRSNNSLFRVFEAVCRLIDVCDAERQDLARLPTLCRSHPVASNARTDVVPDFDGSGRNPLPPKATLRDTAQQVSPAQRVSTSGQICAAAAEYLREKGARAKGPELCQAVLARGVIVQAKNATALISSRVGRSPLFDHTRDGYGLREWVEQQQPVRKQGRD
jgi:hypothetical protein